MKFIETLFLGILVACTALIAQVFITVIAELFFRTSLTFQYSFTDSLYHVGLLMAIAASIEEVLRYIIIKKRTIHHVSGISSIFVYGSLLGIGFASFEMFLALLGHTISIHDMFMIIPVFAVHITLSIFLLFFIKSENETVRDIPFLITSIILHTASNLTLFYFLT
ncbi:MAG TPA: hypothetical protein EYG99_02945 [Candidatus Pacebacteria bacterium]|nr:hypothetical protein [Candidatus Paceibacterota bacterium]